MVARVLSIGIVWAMASAVEAAPSSFDHSADQRVAIGNCAECHQFSDTRSHVTGVRPTFEVPAAYPLNEKGELTCSTCHDVMAPSESSPLIRGGLQGATFCRSCHAASAEDGTRLAHAVRTGAAHTAPPLQNPSRVSRTRPASLDCETCHDGIISEDGHWTPPSQQIGRSGRDLGHPVGVDYSGAQIHSTTLTAVPMLDRAITLENGTVGCTSCHDALSRIPRQLVIDNRGSALCLSCHRL